MEISELKIYIISETKSSLEELNLTPGHSRKKVNFEDRSIYVV